MTAVFLGHVGQGLAPGVERAPLGQGDHLLGDGPGRPGLGQGRPHPLAFEERRHEVAQERPAVGGVPSEHSLLDLVPHASVSFSGVPSLMSAWIRSMSRGWSSRFNPRFRLARVSLISARDLRPKFLVLRSSSSVFCTSS